MLLPQRKWGHPAGAVPPPNKNMIRYSGVFASNARLRVLRVRSQIIDPKTGFLKSVEDRYFITNIHEGRLSKAQWLELIRRHWQVENNCHSIWDRICREDDRVWIREPRGMLAVQLLRRCALNLMALF